MPLPQTIARLIKNGVSWRRTRTKAVSHRTAKRAIASGAATTRATSESTASSQAGPVGMSLSSSFTLQPNSNRASHSGRGSSRSPVR